PAHARLHANAPHPPGIGRRAGLVSEESELNRINTRGWKRAAFSAGRNPFDANLRVSHTALTMDGISRARAKRLAKEFFWVGAGQVAAIVGGLAGIRLLTQALSPASYGELALGMTAASLTQQVVVGPAAGAILRFFAPATEAKQLGDYLKASRRLLAEGTLLLVAIATVSGLALLLF